MQLAQDGAEDAEAGQDRGRDDGVAADSDVEGSWNENNAQSVSVHSLLLLSIEKGKRTVASFIKAMARVAVAREDDDLVSAVLHADGGIDDQALSAADAQVGMQEDDSLARGCFLLGHGDCSILPGHQRRRNAWWRVKKAPDFWV